MSEKKTVVFELSDRSCDTCSPPLSFVTFIWKMLNLKCRSWFCLLVLSAAPREKLSSLVFWRGKCIRTFLLFALFFVFHCDDGEDDEKIFIMGRCLLGPFPHVCPNCIKEIPSTVWMFAENCNSCKHSLHRLFEGLLKCQ